MIYCLYICSVQGAVRARRNYLMNISFVIVFIRFLDEIYLKAAPRLVKRDNN